jgi:hypothetical protein
MTETATTLSENVTTPSSAIFNYYTAIEPLEEDDVTIFTGRSNRLSPIQLPLKSIRGREKHFNIDTHGFQVLRQTSSLSLSTANFRDTEFVKQYYWPEITALLRKAFGVRAAAIMNTTFRDVNEASSFDKKNPRFLQSIPPFYVVHGDYTAKGSRSHLRAIAPPFFDALGSAPYTSPEERETFLKLQAEIVAAQDVAMKQACTDSENWDGKNYHGPRWGIFSVWRPMEEVRRSPLAIMDARDLTSYVELPRVYRNRPGFISEYKSTNIIARKQAEEHHRWYWLPNQKDDEIYAIKLFDSESEKVNGPIMGAAHSAFELEGTSELPPRRSTELRAIVIW